MAGHDGVQADMVLVKELKALHLDAQAAEGDCYSSQSLSIHI